MKIDYQVDRVETLITLSPESREDQALIDILYGKPTTVVIDGDSSMRFIQISFSNKD